MMMKEGKGGKVQHTVEITVDKDGKFSYDKPLVRVHRGDKLVWECTNECPFAIHVGWNSPLDKGRYRSKGKNSIEATVREDAQYGYYFYTVAATINGATWTDDPPFIVKPPGS